MQHYSSLPYLAFLRLSPRPLRDCVLRFSSLEAQLGSVFPFNMALDMGSLRFAGLDANGWNAAS